MQLPEGVARAPEGVLLVHPFPFLLILLGRGQFSAEKARDGEAHLPPLAKPLEGFLLGIRGRGEELAVAHRVEQPLPVLLCNIGDEPRKSLPVEFDVGGKTTLDEEIG